MCFLKRKKGGERENYAVIVAWQVSAKGTLRFKFQEKEWKEINEGDRRGIKTVQDLQGLELRIGFKCCHERKEEGDKELEQRALHTQDKVLSKTLNK